METFLEQSVKFEEGRRVYGTYVVNSQDPQYLSELEEGGKEVGYVDFDYRVETDQLTFKAVGCERFAAEHYQQLVETVWAKIRMIQSYWNSPEYRIRKKMEDRIAETLQKHEKKRK